MSIKANIIKRRDYGAQFIIDFQIPFTQIMSELGRWSYAIRKETVSLILEWTYNKNIDINLQIMSQNIKQYFIRAQSQNRSALSLSASFIVPKMLAPQVILIKNTRLYMIRTLSYILRTFQQIQYTRFLCEKWELSALKHN